MSVIPTISADGVGVVSAGQLNAYLISAMNTAMLRNLSGQTGMTAYLQGVTVPNDGGQGAFYWNTHPRHRMTITTSLFPTALSMAHGYGLRSRALAPGLQAFLLVALV